MYRCVSLYMLRNNIELTDLDSIKDLLGKIKIEQKRINDTDRFFLDGEDVSDKIREKDVNQIVSQVSHIPIVREAMVKLQREYGKTLNIIMEGRDIGTNVFPNADVKIYLDATPEERANRRLKQNKEKGIEMSYEEILENIKFRDNNDKTSDVAPLKMADDAIYVDTTTKTIDEVVEEITKIIERKK